MKTKRSQIHSGAREKLTLAEQVQHMQEGQALGAMSRREATRERILAAMGELIARGERVTGKRLATLTGLNRDTLYQHADLWQIGREL